MKELITKAHLEALFREFYQPLVRHSIHFVRRPEIAEEIVQEVFINLWEKRDKIDFHTSGKSYLYTAVKNRSIDYLRSKFAKLDYVSDELLDDYTEDTDSSMKLEEKELDSLITEIMKSLPERCYLIFSMSRFGNYSNKQISEELNISQRTVETQISKALKRLKQKIEKYLMLLVF